MVSSTSNILALSRLSTGLSLRDLTEQVGPDALRLRGLPYDAPAVQGVLFYDTEGTEQQLAGQLLLLASHSAFSSAQIAKLCTMARDTGSCGIVARGIGEDPSSELAQRCTAAKLPLLELAPSVAWREFDALVSRLLGEHGSGLQLDPNSGDKLFALANTIAGVFKGSVAIEDHRRNILAYSAMPEQAIDDLRANGILYRRVPNKPINEVRYRQVFANPSVSRFQRYDTEAPRASIAIRAGNIPLGSIWAIDPEGDDLSIPLTAEKTEILEQVAILAAGYLVDAWRFDHGAGRVRETALRRTFTGVGQVSDSEALGFRATQQVIVAALVPEKTSLSEAEMSEIRSVTARHLSVYFPGSLCIVIDAAIYALVPSASGSEVERSFQRLLPEILRLSNQRCHVGLDNPTRFQSLTAGAKLIAKAIASCARERGLDVATHSAVLPQLLLRECGLALRAAELSTAEADALRAPGQAEMQRTLLVWCEEQGNAPRIAARLQIHEQTVRYRVRQAVARFNLDLNDPDRILAMWIQLRLADAIANR